MNDTRGQRFWEKVKIPDDDGCWPWQGAKRKVGLPYGVFAWNGDKVRTMVAHRASWIIHFGEIADGLQVLHTCDNPPCVNPSHLFLGRNADNNLDARQKGRAKVGQGEKHGNAKLTDNTVLAIRDAFRLGNTQTEIALEYGVTQSNVHHIVKRKTWRNLP